MASNLTAFELTTSIKNHIIIHGDVLDVQTESADGGFCTCMHYSTEDDDDEDEDDEDEEDEDGENDEDDDTEEDDEDENEEDEGA